MLRGTMPGRVLADDDRLPGTVLVSSPEGNYLASAGPIGDAERSAGRALVQHLAGDEPGIGLFATPDWEQHAESLVPGVQCARFPRRHYALSALAGAWYEHIPVVRLPCVLWMPRFLARPDLQGHHIQRWATGNWGSAEAFLTRGFGFALFDGSEPVSWCLTDCAVDAHCEIGIHTHPAYRRRGLATIVVAAAVAHALTAGYHEVGWHCSEDNQGSQGVAEKVGFTLTHRFHALGWRFEATG
ncbi:MAG: GNAT family N-acetyltransferase [Deltaproteobacteria bacterium]|nr:GNAT family N-acetyltransferase [Deltaproteobacteria bacterium]